MDPRGVSAHVANDGDISVNVAAAKLNLCFRFRFTNECDEWTSIFRQQADNLA